MFSKKKLLASKLAEMNILKQEESIAGKMKLKINDQLTRLKIEESEISSKDYEEKTKNAKKPQRTLPTPSVKLLNPYEKEMFQKQKMKPYLSASSTTDLQGELKYVDLTQLNLHVPIACADTNVDDTCEEEDDETIDF